MPRDERRRLFRENVEGVLAYLPCDLQHVAKAAGGHEGGGCEATLQHRVRCDSGSVHEVRHGPRIAAVGL